MMRARSAKWLLLAGMALALPACSETNLMVHGVKKVAGANTEGMGPYKVGNPYQINGVWYHPAEDYDYDETGVGSWYGPNFHGKLTANGETYDQNDLTAAHRTLPMPSYVRVTNLENGRSIVVRINDRGPFAHSRIIDLSRRSAQLLGMEQQGTAKVRVQIMAEESRSLAARLKGNQPTSPNEPPAVVAAARPSVAAESLAPPPGVKGDAGRAAVQAEAAPARSSLEATAPLPDLKNQQVKTVPVGASQMYIQAGAFARYDNANRVTAALSGYGQPQISTVRGANGGEIYRVRMGPVSTYEQADRLLEQVIKAGYPDAKLIVD